MFGFVKSIATSPTRNANESFFSSQKVCEGNGTQIQLTMNPTPLNEMMVSHAERNISNSRVNQQPPLSDIFIEAVELIRNGLPLRCETEVKKLKEVDQPTKHDIIVGRHKQAFNHIGNARFREVISSFLPRYMYAPTRRHRANLSKEIVDKIEVTGVRFLKEDTKTGLWMELTLTEKRNKVGHALRDAAASERSRQPAPIKSNGGKGTQSKAPTKEEKQPSPEKHSYPNVVAATFENTVHTACLEPLDFSSSSLSGVDGEKSPLLGSGVIEFNSPTGLDLLLSLSK